MFCLVGEVKESLKYLMKVCLNFNLILYKFWVGLVRLLLIKFVMFKVKFLLEFGLMIIVLVKL